MKKSIYSFAILLMISMAISCKKDSEVSKVTGFWEGKYNVVGSSSTRYFAFLYRDNGTVRMFIGTPSSTDTNSVLAISRLESTYENRPDSVVSDFIIPDGSFRTSGKLNNTANIIQGKLEGKGGPSGVLLYTTDFSVTKK